MSIAFATSKNSICIIRDISLNEMDAQDAVHINDLEITDKIVDVRFISKKMVLIVGRRGEMMIYNDDGEKESELNLGFDRIQELRAFEVSEDGHWVVLCIYNFKERKPQLITFEVPMDYTIVKKDDYFVPEEFEEVVLANFNDVVVLNVKGHPVLACNQVSFGHRVMFFALNTDGKVTLLESIKATYENGFQMFNWSDEEGNCYVIAGGETPRANLFTIKRDA